MSKRDYIAVAGIISRQQASWLECNSGSNPMLQRVACDLADHFAKGNTLFDRGRFLRACDPA